METIKLKLKEKTTPRTIEVELPFYFEKKEAYFTTRIKVFRNPAGCLMANQVCKSDMTELQYISMSDSVCFKGEEVDADMRPITRDEYTDFIDLVIHRLAERAEEVAKENNDPQLRKVS